MKKAPRIPRLDGEAQAKDPTQELKRWKIMASKMEPEEYSVFLKGAVLSAIDTARHTKDPKWEQFVIAIQPVAMRVLGESFLKGPAKLYEQVETESRNIVLEKIQMKSKKKHRV